MAILPIVSVKRHSKTQPDHVGPMSKLKFLWASLAVQVQTADKKQDGGNHAEA